MCSRCEFARRTTDDVQLGGAIPWLPSWPVGASRSLFALIKPLIVARPRRSWILEYGVGAGNLNQVSPTPLDAGTENLTPQHSSDAEEPEEEEAEPEGSWTIGEIQLITQPEPNPPLKVRSAGQSSLHSYNFVGKVGEVSFERVAVPDTEIASEPIHLSYDHDAPDGTRLLVEIGSTTVRPSLADRLLIPIARHRLEMSMETWRGLTMWGCRPLEIGGTCPSASLESFSKFSLRCGFSVAG